MALHFISLTLSAAAETEAPLTIERVIAAATRGNPALAAAFAEERRAAAAAIAARAVEEFSLDLVAAAEHTRQPGSGQLFEQLALDSFTPSIELGRTLPTGGHIALRLSADFAQSTSRTSLDTAPDPPMKLYSPSLQLTIVQPLLRGMGPAIVNAPIDRAAALLEVAHKNRMAAAGELLRAAIAAYADLYSAKEELRIRRESADAARGQMAAVEAGIAVGQQPRSATAEIQVAIALRQEEALLAEQVVIERALELQRLMSVPLEPEAPAITALDREPNALGLRETREETREETLRATLETNPELAAVRAEHAAAEIDIALAEDRVLPAVDLTLSGGPTGGASELEDSWSELSRFEGYAVRGALAIHHAFGEGAAEGAALEARERRAAILARERSIIARVTGELLRQLTAARIARERNEVLTKTISVARLDLEAERARFASGRATTFDVLRRQDEVASTEIQHVRAGADEAKASASVDALSGRLLKRWASAFGGGAS